MFLLPSFISAFSASLFLIAQFRLLSHLNFVDSFFFADIHFCILWFCAASTHQHILTSWKVIVAKMNPRIFRKTDFQYNWNIKDYLFRSIYLQIHTFSDVLHYGVKQRNKRMCVKREDAITSVPTLLHKSNTYRCTCTKSTRQTKWDNSRWRTM